MIQTIKHTAIHTANNKKLIFIHTMKDIIFISIGIILASIGLKCFLLPNQLLDGGAMGVALLIERVTDINLSILILIINIPFLLISSKQISIIFAIKSTLAILCLAILLNYIKLPTVTNDKLLISVFGGFFLGAGIGFSIRGGAVIDGSEALAVTLSRNSTLTVGDVISVFNIILFCIASLLINIETAMYSILIYIAASKTVDFIVNGIEEYIGVYIVSKKSEAIRNQIMNVLNRGVTIFKAEEGAHKHTLKGHDGHVLFCVVTRLEVSKLLLEIEKIDNDCFIVQCPIRDTKGGMIKKRRLH